MPLVSLVRYRFRIEGTAEECSTVLAHILNSDWGDGEELGASWSETQSSRGHAGQEEHG